MSAEATRASPSVGSVTSNGTSHKRKRGGDSIKYYAVREGRKPGVYHTWEECLSQIKGHKGALFQSFPSIADARAFANGERVSTAVTGKNGTGEQKFYAVQIGRVPGVYTDWPSASAQIAGVKHPKHRKFATRAEAEAFVAEGRKGSAAAAVAAAQQLDKRMKLVNGAVAPAGLILNDKEKDAQGNIDEPGTGPLPPGAEDGFDPNITLSPSGTLIHKPDTSKTKTKTIPKPAPPPAMLTIYTDGSSLSNGRHGARAGVGVYFGPSDPKNVSEPLPAGSRQTNQRAELTAILRALDLAPRHRDVTIYTDSRYAIDCVTNWYKNWRMNGWVTANRKAVENRDLIQEVRSRIEEREGLGRGTYFVWVRGHNGDRGNVEADRLAVEGARKVVGRGDGGEGGVSGGGGGEVSEVGEGQEGQEREDDGDGDEETIKALEEAMAQDEEFYQQEQQQQFSGFARVFE